MNTPTWGVNKHLDADDIHLCPEEVEDLVCRFLPTERVCLHWQIPLENASAETAKTEVGCYDMYFVGRGTTLGDLAHEIAHILEPEWDDLDATHDKEFDMLAEFVECALRREIDAYHWPR